jgi:hypothetical protein
MGADIRRPWLLRSTMWSQEPYRVLSRVAVPVHLVRSGDTPSKPASPARKSGKRPGKRSAMASAKN